MVYQTGLWWNHYIGILLVLWLVRVDFSSYLIRKLSQNNWLVKKDKHCPAWILEKQLGNPKICDNTWNWAELSEEKISAVLNLLCLFSSGVCGRMPSSNGYGYVGQYPYWTILVLRYTTKMIGKYDIISFLSGVIWVIHVPLSNPSPMLLYIEPKWLNWLPKLTFCKSHYFNLSCVSLLSE